MLYVHYTNFTLESMSLFRFVIRLISPEMPIHTLYTEHKLTYIGGIRIKWNVIENRILHEQKAHSSHYG